MRYLLILITLLATTQVRASEQPTSKTVCSQLHRLTDVTIIYTESVSAAATMPAHCYVKGLVGGDITFHMMLPATWNGRLVHLGDGGADGDLDTLPSLVGDGYAVVNSNTGHDTGAEAMAYAFRNDRAAVNFAYWSVHTTTTVAKRIVEAYYGRPHTFAYHYGCSTGGRQALVAAQLFPDDFDGIVAGAPANHQFQRMAHRLNVSQQLFADSFRNNLAFDADGNGTQESLVKLRLLSDLVLDRCDARDGITDGIIEPQLCDFQVERDLAAYLCVDNTDAETCFTPGQLDSVRLLYEGSRNSKGVLVYPGAPLGSELQWPSVFIPHEGNQQVPYALQSAAAVIAYSFYADDPGLIPSDLGNTNLQLDTDAALPEWGWWTFDIDDVGAPGMSAEAPMMEASDPDLSRFFFRHKGRLLMFHGWADAVIPPAPTLNYHQAVIDTVFRGDANAASLYLQLYMAPGVGHCRGGPGPDRADFLSVLRDWVEDGKVPTSIVARHYRGEALDNERPLCPYPQRAVFSGTAGSAADPDQWRAHNFSCEAPD